MVNDGLKDVKILDPEKIEWKPIEQYPKGAWSKTLYVDEKTGATAMIVKFDKGFREPPHTHPSNLHMIFLKGKLVDAKGNEIRAGMYVFVPAGVEHGPFDTPEECIFFAYFDGPP